MVELLGGFTFAGLRADGGHRVIGTVADGVETVLAELNDLALQADRWYQVDLMIELNQVTLYADGQAKVTWQRTSSAPPITGGRVGLMVRGGAAEFQELEQWDVGHGSGASLASPPPPTVTFAHAEYFDGSDPGWHSPVGEDWRGVAASAYWLKAYEPGYLAITVAPAAWAMPYGHLRARVRTVSEEGRPVNAQLLFENQDIGLVELT